MRATARKQYGRFLDFKGTGYGLVPEFCTSPPFSNPFGKLNPIFRLPEPGTQSFQTSFSEGYFYLDMKL